jgi:hypothetical protein
VLGKGSASGVEIAPGPGRAFAVSWPPAAGAPADGAVAADGVGCPTPIGWAQPIASAKKAAPRIGAKRCEVMNLGWKV